MLCISPIVAVQYSISVKHPFVLKHIQIFCDFSVAHVWENKNQYAKKYSNNCARSVIVSVKKVANAVIFTESINI